MYSITEQWSSAQEYPDLIELFHHVLHPQTTEYSATISVHLVVLTGFYFGVGFITFFFSVYAAVSLIYIKIYMLQTLSKNVKLFEKEDLSSTLLDSVQL